MFNKENKERINEEEMRSKEVILEVQKNAGWHINYAFNRKKSKIWKNLKNWKE